jgi:glycine dehydrogenase
MSFEKRHIAIEDKDLTIMLQTVGESSLQSLIDKTIPTHIARNGNLNLPDAINEYEYLNHVKSLAQLNKTYKSYIGLGYYNTITPTVILRNIFENPGWYTQYTPYQAEIAQGRMEALLNYQTMITELTGLPIANASLLDEGTAAAEAMLMLHSQKENKDEQCNTILVSDNCFPQTIALLQSRANPLNINVEVSNESNWILNNTIFACVVQYPDGNGNVNDYKTLCDNVHNVGAKVIVAADIMSLLLLQKPSEFGADIAVGTTQRFGVPIGYGGPHAAYFACSEAYKRHIPGRIIGVSIDRLGNRALRMALQTREQHIRREKATSNICTAQALLSIMASMYAVYHGPKGLKEIATKIHQSTKKLNKTLTEAGLKQVNTKFFDTLKIEIDDVKLLQSISEKHEINFRIFDTSYIGISINETTSNTDLDAIVAVFNEYLNTNIRINHNDGLPIMNHETNYLSHAVFNSHHSETQMLRYIKKLENRDLSLGYGMIPLGSCTMKLNATTEMMPLSWAEFSSIHPFVPVNQAKGYLQIMNELESYLCEVTEFTACSLQPNSGAQGEYAGLLCIRAYHANRNETNRNIMIIPASAHGTNPASAVMAGMQVVVTKCTENGDIDLVDLKEKATLHKDNLAGLMVTYPSTHGVFEGAITTICELIHELGGLVYMDGANMNAQVGLTSPSRIGADVCHINLHKTFSIPHGGGGPGMGPICVNDKLAPFLPTHPLLSLGGADAILPVSAAPYGSASILLISYGYIRMLGYGGVKRATEYAILNANYIKTKIQNHYPVLYTGEHGNVAHELIIDCRELKNTCNVEVEDIAKRLIDYGFHAPTVSFPVAGTLMIEPTESEDLNEINRFCEAMIAIRKEIELIENGTFDKEKNPLKNAPHTAHEAINDNWNHPYSRELAVYPDSRLKESKFWPFTARVNNAHGDRNLVCTCAPIESYM